MSPPIGPRWRRQRRGPDGRSELQCSRHERARRVAVAQANDCAGDNYNRRMATTDGSLTLSETEFRTELRLLVTEAGPKNGIGALERRLPAPIVMRGAVVAVIEISWP